VRIDFQRRPAFMLSDWLASDCGNALIYPQDAPKVALSLSNKRRGRLSATTHLMLAWLAKPRLKSKSLFAFSTALSREIYKSKISRIGPLYIPVFAVG
jgi:hypothetical protein